MYQCKYFKIKEIVSKYVFMNYPQSLIWSFFDEDVLKDLDAIREAWGSGIIINNWSAGGGLSQCGLRCNLDPLVKDKTKAGKTYLSAHCLSKAFDLHPSNGKYLDFYNFVCSFIKQGKTKKIKRVENFKSTGTWVHIDAFRTPDNGLQIFNA